MSIDLRAKYAPVFARIAEGSLEREVTRTLPFEPVEWLKEAGFTAVRVPVEFGGDGATVQQLFALLVDLASVDPHVPQAFRGHIGFVEDRLWAEDAAWLRRFADGELVGNAVTEIGNVALGDTTTRLSVADDGSASISGRKYYTTGSIFAEWIDALALDPSGAEVAAIVSTKTDRVTVSDDWTGFGQRLTGSGTAIFDAAPVDPDHVYPFGERFDYQTALYQLVLVAVQAGITRAAARDAIEQVANRARTFSHGNAARTRDDPQILEIIGELETAAFTTEAIVIHAASALDAASSVAHASPEVRQSHKQAAELAVAQAQIAVHPIALNATTRLFDALGASATSTSSALDRHWRNARTVGSHNPVAFKARTVGDAAVNGTEPPYEWSIGVPKTHGVTDGHTP